MATKPDVGEIKASQHYFSLRIYLEDTDAGGIVYHSNYLKFMERARTDFLRLMGISHKEMMNGPNPAMFAVKSLAIEYRLPARLDDSLEVRSRLRQIGGASFALDQKIWRGDQEICEARVRLALLDHNGRPSRMDLALGKKLKILLVGEALGKRGIDQDAD